MSDVIAGPRSGHRGGLPARKDPQDLAQLDATRSACAVSARSSARTPAACPSSWGSSWPRPSSGWPPLLTRHLIDEAIPQQDVQLLLLLVGGMLAVTVVSSVLGVLQTWLSTTVGQRVMHGLRTDVFTHLQRQSLDFFTRTRGGEVQSRLTHDIGAMQSVVTTAPRRSPPPHHGRAGPVLGVSTDTMGRTTEERER
ncbi:ABC transporter transmembrane domain-containing protein [Georgenia sp. SUBG003]|uniref:ABC transporter transmembrane domain-containing protein n=1 Tax=Georgenia sp. SUBG003 TaxID=1497974 RepID=UPI003AB83EF5